MKAGVQLRLPALLLAAVAISLVLAAAPCSRRRRGVLPNPARARQRAERGRPNAAVEPRPRPHRARQRRLRRRRPALAGGRVDPPGRRLRVEGGDRGSRRPAEAEQRDQRGVRGGHGHLAASLRPRHVPHARGLRVGAARARPGELLVRPAGDADAEVAGGPVQQPRPASARRSLDGRDVRRAGDGGARREGGRAERLPQHPRLAALRHDRHDRGLVVQRHRPVRLYLRDRRRRAPPAVSRGRQAVPRLRAVRREGQPRGVPARARVGRESEAALGDHGGRRRRARCFG